jgi:hypothetical protein
MDWSVQRSRQTGNLIAPRPISAPNHVIARANLSSHLQRGAIESRNLVRMELLVGTAWQGIYAKKPYWRRPSACGIWLAIFVKFY